MPNAASLGSSRTISRTDTSLRRLEVPGSLASSARTAEQQLGRIESTAGRTDRATRRIELAGGLRRDAQQAERSIREIEAAADDAADATGRVGDGLGEIGEGSGDSSGAGFLAGFAGKIKGLAGKGGPIAAALVGVAAVGLTAGSILAQAVADGMEQEAAQDLIQSKLGISEEAARRIGTAGGAAYSNGWGESVASNMDAARLAVRGGILTGDEDAKTIQGTIESLDILSTKLDADVSDSVKAVSALMSSGLASNATEAFDLIARASDGTANKADDLLESISEYSSGWEQAGFSAKYTLGLISQSTDNGSDSADRASDAIREFGRRVYEEGDTIKETLSGLGFDAEDMYAKFQAGGPDSEEAFDQVFDAIRRIEDPSKKAAAAQALLGDTAGDFIGAFTRWDPSAAVTKFGDVADAAANAGTVMSSNTAASFDSATRSIEMSSADIKLALAGAFGPALQNIATWVGSHKPEIIGFFTGLADAGFATLDGVLAFTSGSLRALADFGDFTGATMGVAISAVGGFATTLGGIIENIPGMEDIGSDIKGAGESATWYGDQVQTASDKLRSMADTIDTARPHLQGMRQDIADAGAQAQGSAELVRALGTAVVQDVPGSKDIVIRENTPEVQGNLERLGIAVESMPDGSFKLVANTAEGQAAIDAFQTTNNGKSVEMFVNLEQRRIGYWTSQGVSAEDAPAMQGPTPVLNAAGGSPDGGRFGGGGGGFADGKLPGEALIHPAGGRGLVQWAEEGAGPWEAFIPGAPSKRGRATSIVADVAQRFGYGLVKMADGGVIGKGGIDESMAWARSVDSAKYGMGGFSSSTLDCSGAASAAINKAVGLDAFDSRMSTVNEGAWLQAKGAILGKGGPGTLRVGWWDKGGGANGHTAITYPDETNFESNGSEGVVVGGPTGADDPQFDQHAYFVVGGDLGAPATNGRTASSAGGSGGGAGTTSDLAAWSKSGGAIDSQPVHVTNWPAQFGGQQNADDQRPLKARLTANLYADGGLSPMSGRSASVVAPNTWRVVGDRQQNDEFFIPDTDQRQHVAIGAEWARRRGLTLVDAKSARERYGLTAFANGGVSPGFGGYSGPDRSDSMKPRNIYEAASLGIGMGFAALSGASGLIGMAQSGQWDLGQLVKPEFDTGANSSAVLEEGFSKFTDQVTERLDAIFAALQKGGMIDARINVDTNSGKADMALMQAGLA